MFQLSFCLHRSAVAHADVPCYKGTNVWRSKSQQGEELYKLCFRSNPFSSFTYLYVCIDVICEILNKICLN